jgi:radical SAM protein with 4Fe4S-binding SPASM domain
MTTININPLHFIYPVPLDEAQQLFKDTVQNIEIAISSFCNRKCTYCPNSLYDRHSKREYMADSLFDALLKQLSEINYKGRIALHRYNEPLADPDYALKRISQIKNALPNSQIWIYTNGDYLTPSLIEKLEKSGVHQLLVTSHALPKDKEFNIVRNRMLSRLKKLKLSFLDHELSSDKTENWVTINSNEKMQHSWRAINFYSNDSLGNLKMSDRGESLNVNNEYSRNSPCVIPFTEMQIEWDGTILPCCNIHSDVPEHQSYVLGKFTENTNIFSIYTNQSFVKWRKTLFDFGPKEKPCKTCNFDSGSLPQEMIPTVKHIRQSFGLD